MIKWNKDQALTQGWNFLSEFCSLHCAPQDTQGHIFIASLTKIILDKWHQKNNLAKTNKIKMKHTQVHCNNLPVEMKIAFCWLFSHTVEFCLLLSPEQL